MVRQTLLATVVLCARCHRSIGLKRKKGKKATGGLPFSIKKLTFQAEGRVWEAWASA
jgi:hypothetical protein